MCLCTLTVFKVQMYFFNLSCQYLQGQELQFFQLICHYIACIVNISFPSLTETCLCLWKGDKADKANGSKISKAV